VFSHYFYVWITNYEPNTTQVYFNSKSLLCAMTLSPFRFPLAEESNSGEDVGEEGGGRVGGGEGGGARWWGCSHYNGRVRV
jgi:hypothetical protein